MQKAYRTGVSEIEFFCLGPRGGFIEHGDALDFLGEDHHGDFACVKDAGQPRQIGGGEPDGVSILNGEMFAQKFRVVFLPLGIGQLGPCARCGQKFIFSCKFFEQRGEFTAMTKVEEGRGVKDQ